ncbi:hypothetical protein ACRAVF_33845 (plasmid) [Bradyrhizobium oligotrophicum S58]
MNVRADSREFEYWQPEPLFAGATVFCLASGPSLTPAIAEQVSGRPSIVINSSCLLAPSATVLYFTDSSWYEQHRELVAGWPGLIISMSRTAKRELPDKVRRILGDGDPVAPPDFRTGVQQGRTSGHTAIALAIALGARRVVLLGYDMRVVDGREHCHDDYRGPRDLDQYARDFVPAFAGWNAAACRVGVAIVNATPDSAVTEFPFADLDQVLACDPS